MLVVASVITLSAIEDSTTTEILFEVCSAFGTTGLSTGVTRDFSAAGKAVLILMM
jgi:Trk-type K+ transport system membrane component